MDFRRRIEAVAPKLDALQVGRPGQLAKADRPAAAAHLPADEGERLNAALETGLTGYTYLDDAPLA